MMIIGNGTVLTNVRERMLIPDGAVVVENGGIVHVGPGEEIVGKYAGHEFVDARGGIIMPGLVNLHHHFYSALARGMVTAGPSPASRNFMQILENLWWRLDKALSLDDIRVSAAVSLADSIRCGVTTIVDHHASFGVIRGTLDAIAGEVRAFGARACLCFEVSDRCGESAAREAIAENSEFLDAVRKNGDGMLAGLFGLHASFTLSDATLAACREAAGDSGFHVHVAEGGDDVADALGRSGKRVVQRLGEFGVFGPKTLAVHCVHVSPAEMDILAAADCTVVHNPQSNMGNAVGASPLLQFFAHDVRVGVGTDGYTHDIFESAKAAGLLQRHHLANPSVAWGEPYAMLLDTNPRVAGDMLGVGLGVLEPGAAADVIVVDYHPHTPLLAENIGGHMHFGMYGQQVATSMINGRLVMRDRELLTVDEQALRAESRELAAKLWQRI